MLGRKPITLLCLAIKRELECPVLTSGKIENQRTHSCSLQDFDQAREVIDARVENGDAGGEKMVATSEGGDAVGERVCHSANRRLHSVVNSIINSATC